ncbi:MAG: segregation/condensation protein A [Phycisphaerales bacterium]|nr:segregation/condensation protein A [Phycisphaerales bacterium]
MKPLQDDYQVRLANFEGPLDLLLFLIRRAEIDIHDIPIVSITGQYFEYLKQIDEIDIELAGEFLVIAASLIEIKSRTLRPPKRIDGEDVPEDVGEGLEAADPRYELVQQLLAYQRYRVASERLDEHRFDHARRFSASAKVTDVTTDDDETEEPEALEMDDVHLGDLIDAYQRIVEAVDFGKIGEHEVEYDDTPLALHEQDLLDRIDREETGRITLQRVFTGRRRIEMIGLFLAVLELARNQKVRVVQEDVNDEIALELVPESERELPPGEDDGRLVHVSDLAAGASGDVTVESTNDPAHETSESDSD